VLKINWFSPLPPVRSGIAHYAMQVLPVLAGCHEVVLWTDQDQVAPEAHRIARIARFDPASPPWRELNNGAISIYHLGNHPDFNSRGLSYCMIFVYRISSSCFWPTPAETAPAILPRWSDGTARKAGTSLRLSAREASASNPWR
jgi:hypothetical protein